LGDKGKGVRKNSNAATGATFVYSWKKAAKPVEVGRKSKEFAFVLKKWAKWWW
jgi:hypothetical protein